MQSTEKLRARLLLGDDHALMLEGLRQILSGNYEVVGVAPDGRALVRAAKEIRPDAVLLDVSMPEMNGIEAARQIRIAVPETKIIFISMHTSRPYVTAAFGAGASGYVVKQAAAQELMIAVDQVLSGGQYLSPGLDILAGESSSDAADQFGADLTRRQREVLQLIAEGKQNKQVATSLSISVKTAEFHRAALMEKLGLRSTAELTRYAVKHRLVDAQNA